MACERHAELQLQLDLATQTGYADGSLLASLQTEASSLAKLLGGVLAQLG